MSGAKRCPNNDLDLFNSLKHHRALSEAHASKFQDSYADQETFTTEDLNKAYRCGFMYGCQLMFDAVQERAIKAYKSFLAWSF